MQGADAGAASSVMPIWINAITMPLGALCFFLCYVLFVGLVRPSSPGRDAADSPSAELLSSTAGVGAKLCQDARPPQARHLVADRRGAPRLLALRPLRSQLELPLEHRPDPDLGDRAPRNLLLHHSVGGEQASLSFPSRGSAELDTGEQAIMVGLSRFAKEHTWLLPLVAIGLIAPRWAQMLWGTSGIGFYVPWVRPARPRPGALLMDARRPARSDLTWLVRTEPLFAVAVADPDGRVFVALARCARRDTRRRPRLGPPPDPQSSPRRGNPLSQPGPSVVRESRGFG